MKDYKKLIEELKRNGLSNGGALGHHSGLCDEAADAIEQLIKARGILRDALDAAHEDERKAEAKAAKCELAVMCLTEELADMKLERDAAVSDLEAARGVCRVCRHRSACGTPIEDYCDGENWEWRGIQE